MGLIKAGAGALGEHLQISGKNFSTATHFRTRCL